MATYDVGGGRTADAVLSVGGGADSDQGDMGLTTPAEQSAYTAQRAGERESVYQTHIVRDPDTGDEYRVYAPPGVSASRVMELANEQIGRMGQENAQGLKAQLITPDSAQPQRPQLNAIQKTVRQGAAPIVGATLGAVGGAAAAPFTAGVINPLTGAMIGGAVGEAVNQYVPGWNEFTQSVKDPYAIAITGLSGALPGVGRSAAKLARPVSQEALTALRNTGGLGNLMAAGGGALFMLNQAADVFHAGIGALGALALKNAPNMIAKALGTSEGRAALKELVTTPASRIVQSTVQAGRVFSMNPTTGDLEARQRARRGGI